MVLMMSPELHDVAATVSKITLSEEEQETISTCVKRWTTSQWKSLYKRAQREVVIPQVYTNLQYLEEPPLWNQVKASYYNAWVHKQNLLSESKRVAALFLQHNVEFLFLKGMVLDNLYRPTWRAMADIDILVKDFTHAKESLSEIDYILDDMWTANQGEFGVANLYCVERKTKIDLHFGEYPVHSLGSFHLPLWERKRGGEIPMLSYEDNLLVLASHVFNHGFYLMRDINDTYVMLQENLDWQYVTTRAQELSLEPPLCVLLKAAASVYGIDGGHDCSGSFLYTYGCRRHFLQQVLQLHHLLLFSQVKNLLSYPWYCVSSCISGSKSVIDPPWTGRASPRWINRIDRKRLCNADEHAFRSSFSDAAVQHGMRFIFDSNGVYIEKQDLQEKDIERARDCVEGEFNERANRNAKL
jgi:hypothetical protein